MCEPRSGSLVRAPVRGCEVRAAVVGDETGVVAVEAASYGDGPTQALWYLEGAHPLERDWVTLPEPVGGCSANLGTIVSRRICKCEGTKRPITNMQNCTLLTVHL